MASSLVDSEMCLSSHVKFLPLKWAFAIALILGAAVFLRSCANEHYRPHGHVDMTFDISPDGNMLVFNAVGEGGRDLYILELATNIVTRIAATPEYEVAPSFSPDGKSIVYAAGAPGDRADHLFVRSLDGAGPRQLTNADANDAFPRFSPDGSQIVFERDKTYIWGGLAANWGGDEGIYVINLDGTEEQQVTPEGLIATCPSFSNDGLQIRFWSNGGLHAIDRDKFGVGTSSPTGLRSSSDVAFSTDGSMVAFSDGTFAPDLEIFVAFSDGTERRRITESDEGCFHPRFMPDGKQILYFKETWPNGLTGEPKHSIWSIGIDGADPQEIAPYELFDDPLHRPPAIE